MLRRRPSGVAHPQRSAFRSTRGDQLALPAPRKARPALVWRLSSCLRSRTACGLGRGRRLARAHLGHVPLQLGR